MKALLLYVMFVVVGAAIAVGIGLLVERETNSVISLMVFLTLFFVNFGVAWILTILVMDGSLKNAQGRADQREAERVGREKMRPARATN
jgi:flagellar biosynthesis/type III secretory pathway M-ring protein FliF/YscJ